MIQQWQSDPRNDQIQILQHWLDMLGLTDRLEARKLDDVTLEIRIGRLQQSENSTRNGMVSIADVGFGVSQVLPALVALLAAPRDGLVYIEQPELHLHPNPQVKLAHIFAQMANAGGASIVIETHSSLLIREIQTLVAEGKVDPSIVSLNWCNRDPKTGATTVTQAELGKDGSYGDWPIDFDDVAMASERRYWDATAVRKRR
jgi:predicted ATPase